MASNCRGTLPKVLTVVAFDAARDRGPLCVAEDLRADSSLLRDSRAPPDSRSIPLRGESIVVRARIAADLEYIFVIFLCLSDKRPSSIRKRSHAFERKNSHLVRLPLQKAGLTASAAE